LYPNEGKKRILRNSFFGGKTYESGKSEGKNNIMVGGIQEGGTLEKKGHRDL